MVCTIHNLFYDDVYEEEGDFTTDIDDKIRSLEEVINTFINEDFPKWDAIHTPRNNDYHAPVDFVETSLMD